MIQKKHDGQMTVSTQEGTLKRRDLAAVRTMLYDTVNRPYVTMKQICMVV